MATLPHQNFKEIKEFDTKIKTNADGSRTVLIWLLACFTLWNLVFLLWRPWFIDIHLSCLLVAFVSFGILNIDPRIIVIPTTTTSNQENAESKIVIQTNTTLFLCVIDFILHWLPLLYVLLYVKIRTDPFAIEYTFFLFITYVIFFDAVTKYRANIPLSIFLSILAVFIRIRAV